MSLQKVSRFDVDSLSHDKSSFKRQASLGEPQPVLHIGLNDKKKSIVMSTSEIYEGEENNNKSTEKSSKKPNKKKKCR